MLLLLEERESVSEEKAELCLQKKKPFRERNRISKSGLSIFYKKANRIEKMGFISYDVATSFNEKEVQGFYLFR